MLRDEKNIFPLIKNTLIAYTNKSVRVFAYGSRIRDKGIKNDFDVLVMIDPFSMKLLTRIKNKGLIENTFKAVEFWTDLFAKVRKDFEGMKDEFGNDVKIDLSPISVIPNGVIEIE